MIVVVFPWVPFLAILVFFLFGALVSLGGMYGWDRLSRLRHALSVISPESCFCATATSDVVEVRDCARRRLQSRLYTNCPLRTLLWSPDGACLATVSREGVVCVWNAWTGRLLFPPHTLSAAGTSVAWSPSSRHFAIVTPDQSIHVWDVETWERVYTSLLPSLTVGWTLCDLMHYRVEAMVWSSNGRYLAVAESGGALRVWDRDTLSLWVWQDEYKRSVRSMAFFDEAPFLLLGDETGKVSVLHVLSGQREFWSHQHGSPIRAVYWGGGDLSGNVYVQDTSGNWLQWERLEVLGSWYIAREDAFSAKIA